MVKQPFRLIRKWRDDEGELRCEYEASLWEGPIEAGQVGRYIRVKCADHWLEDSERFASTAPSVSYYRELVKAVTGRSVEGGK